MRIAIVSDLHGNLGAFEAVLADLRTTAPDLVLHGGDLADSGASPAEIVDRIRDLGWRGVAGNTDELLFRPASLAEFARESAGMAPLAGAIEQMAQWTRERLGAARLTWLEQLPKVVIEPPLALVHATPESVWRAPSPESPDEVLEATYRPLGQPVAVYGHIHRAFTRSLPGLTIANTGSVSLSYDGDPRAAYLLLDDGKPEIRRVEYAIDKELTALAASGLPHHAWVAAMLQTATPRLP